MKIHEYVIQHWGHAISMIRPEKDGTVFMMGHGLDIKRGDHLMVKMGSGKIGYMEVHSIHYFDDPSDMWKAITKFHSYKE